MLTYPCRTKIFIRFPKTLFETEDRFQNRKHELVTQITALFRMYQQRKVYHKMQWSGELLVHSYDPTIMLCYYYSNDDSQTLETCYCSALCQAVQGSCNGCQEVSKWQHVSLIDYVLNRFVIGFKNRNKPKCPENVNVRSS